MCKKILTTLFTLALSVSAVAEQISAPQWKLSLAAGRGVLENPLADHPDAEVSVLPSFSYYGDRFFISNLTAGYTLLEQRHFYIDLVARPNEDGLYYKLGDDAIASGSLSSFMFQSAPLFPRAAPEVSEVERDVSVVAGPSATLVTDYVDLSFSWLHDVTGVHNGSETHLSLDKQFPLFGGVIGGSIGAINKDADLVNYYYQFSLEEAGPLYARRYANLYPVDDVTDQYARLHFAYPLGKQLEVRLAARYNYFDLDGRNARFIEDDETLHWFVGLQYTIGSGQ
ncbi:MipA/OmpV family protein [uncultured Microbulbifer sp.]|uniref:MipA/OmpV family protein n=1 Tax=uncultured Microbulbifer sp. TaxID=348147 RepID=UPI0025D23D7F|nr:MipA/OmpV family protein [uncultured Microbulbifer sp.]